jgi:hypothetical protein
LKEFDYLLLLLKNVSAKIICALFVKQTNKQRGNIPWKRLRFRPTQLSKAAAAATLRRCYHSREYKMF